VQQTPRRRDGPEQQDASRGTEPDEGGRPGRQQSRPARPRLRRDSDERSVALDLLDPAEDRPGRRDGNVAEPVRVSLEEPPPPRRRDGDQAMNEELLAA